MAQIREELSIVDKFSAAFSKFLKLGESAASAAEKVEKSTRQMGESAGKAGEQITRSFQSSDNAGKSLLATAKSLLLAVGGMAAIKRAVGLSDELTLMQSRLAAVNDSYRTTAELQNAIFASAQRARGDYMAMATTVAKLKAQTGDTFASIKEATAFTELLQKQFKLAGTDAVGIQSTMYNLTQALSTGVLRGQDLNIVFSNAPQLVKRIADYMGVPIGQIRKMAEAGQISADVVKNAMLGAADDINKQFEAMPLTFGDAVQKVKNTAIRGFEPIRQLIANDVASPEFDQLAQTLSVTIAGAATVAAGALRGLGRAFSAGVNIAKTYGKYLAILTAAVVAYKVATAVSTGVTAAHAAVTGVAATAKTIYTAATAAATAGQSAFNAALAACPITWIIVGIIAVITAVAMLIVWLHQTAETGHTVCGDIAGFFTGLWAAILNGLAIVGNFFISVAEGIVNFWNDATYTISKAVYDFASGAIDCFNGISNGAAEAASNLANCFVDGANEAIRGINGIIRAMNNIPGMNIGEVGEIGKVSLSGPKISKDFLTAPTKSAPVTFDRFETTSMAGAFNSGFEKGAAAGDSFQNNIVDSINGLKNSLTDISSGYDFGDLYDGVAENAIGGDGTTGGKKSVGSVDKVKKIEDCKLSDEDLKIYKDLAERRYMNNIELQTLAPNISVSIPEGQARNLSAQDIADKIKVMLIEQAAAHTAVSHT